MQNTTHPESLTSWIKTCNLTISHYCISIRVNWMRNNVALKVINGLCISQLTLLKCHLYTAANTQSAGMFNILKSSILRDTLFVMEKFLARPVFYGQLAC